MRVKIKQLAILCSLLWLSGCASLISGATSRMAGNMSDAIVNQQDPETVRQGAPAFLLMMDGFVRSSPDNPDLLQGAAKLFAVYGSVFVNDPARAQTLTAQGWNYGQRALCVAIGDDCDWRGLGYDALVAKLDQLDRKDSPALFAYTISWLAYIRAHSDNLGSVADLPMVEASLERVRHLDPEYESATVHQYLGILNSLRPPALGGRPDLGQQFFEQAIELSGGQDLSIKVEYARNYARLLYDRELHDRLLVEVVEADPVVPGYTLFNTLAQQEAERLLLQADDYF